MRKIRCKETGMTYASAASAARDIGISSTTIATAIKQGRPTLDGLHFEYCETAKNIKAMSQTLKEIKDLLNNPQVMHNLQEFKKDLHDRNQKI